MGNIFEDLPLSVAQQLEQLSRLAFDLREQRKRLLQRHGADSEDVLLQLVSQGAIPKQPALQDSLSARVLAQTREGVRDQIKALLAGRPLYPPENQ